MPWLLKVVTIMAAVLVILDVLIGWRLTATIRKSDKTLAAYLLSGWTGLCLLFLVYPGWCLYQYYGVGYIQIYEEPPSWMMYLFWFGLGFSAQLIGWILLADILKIMAKALKWLSGNALSRYHQIAYLAIFIGVFSYTGYVMYSNSAHIQTEHIQISIENLSSSLQNVRIIHVSDVQADRFTGRKKMNRFVEKINSRNPDLVLFTGDLVSWGTDYIEEGARAMSGIQAKHGVYAVLGDHDFWAGKDSVRKALEKNGIRFLDNENRYLTINNAEIVLTGITQIYDQRINNTLLKTLLNEGAESDLSILFSHQINRKIADITRSHNYHIALGGHTHGGQFAPALLGFPISAPMLETDFVSGVYWVGELFININNGLGYTLAPVRLHAPAEISVIELQPASNGNPSDIL